jgi:predicted nucleotidyltransferase
MAHPMNEAAHQNPSPALPGIPGLSAAASERLLAVLAAEPAVRGVWLYGSRAMGRQRSGSDIDLTLIGETLEHRHLLQLLTAIDDLLLPWNVDLSLQADLSEDLLDHIRRVGRPLLLPGR